MRLGDAGKVNIARFCCAVIGLFGLAHAKDAQAGAWPAAPGKGQVISTTLFNHASKGYDDNGKLIQNVSFNKADGIIYWEHGVTPKATLVLQSSYQDVELRAGVVEVNFSGVGESYAGLRSVLWQDNEWVISGQAGVLFAGSGEAVAGVDLGFGTTNYEFKALIGRSFKFAQRDGFMDVQAAYRLRPGRTPDEWRLDATAGWRPHKKLQILTQSFYTTSQEQFEVVGATRRLKLQASLVYDRNTKTSYQIGFYQTIFGRNIIKEQAFFFSIWKRY